MLVAQSFQLFATHGLSMKFSSQEYWSGLSFPSPGDLPDPGIEPGSSVLQSDSLPSYSPGKPIFKVGVQI